MVIGRIIEYDSCYILKSIKMDLQVGWGRVMDWIDLAQDRDGWRAVVNAVMDFWCR
jgi:hypothetical protein